MQNLDSKKLVLGSSSVFRKALLQRLHLDFISDAPDIDETALPDEQPKDHVLRLALEKAKAVAIKHPQSLVIASDQCAVLDGQITGKPGNHANAVKQLQQSSGNTVSFYTSLCVYDTSDDTWQLDMIPFFVDFRELNTSEIETYLRVEQPYSCAGSFKSEGYGISLFKRLHGDDPTALIGLPLIRLCEMLRVKGIPLP